MSTNAVRLAKAVLDRRRALDRSQMDVWQAGGPSNTTLTEIENARTVELTRTTARRLDIGLRWETGSARRVWEGGEPTPLTDEDPREDLRQRIEAATYLTREQKDAALAAIRGDDNPGPDSGEVRAG